MSCDHEPVTYTNADLSQREFQASVNRAKDLWKRQCDKYISEHGDQGTCVLGAGIEVWYLAPRCRIHRTHMIISQHQVTGAQGSLVWEASVNEVLAFLKSEGIIAFYNQGRMD
jgi:hypothetical protein